MAITNATRVADFGSGIGTEGAVLQVDNTNDRLGVGTTNPQAMLQVGTGVSVYGNSGIVSATSFYGDGANLTNVGVDTATVNTDQLNVIGVTTVGAAVTINSTGIDAVSGVITAATFKGALTGNVTGNVTGNCSGTSGSATGTAGGLTGTPDITVRNITGVAATFTGVLTYEDVTNVDSIGIVTARGGLEVGAAGVGGTISSGGNVIFAGITTVGTGLSLADDIEARFGNAGDLKLYHDGSNSFIKNTTGRLDIKSDSYLYLESDNRVYIGDVGMNETFAIFKDNEGVELFYNNSKKFETHNTGVTITGVCTATSFAKADGSAVGGAWTTLASGLVDSGGEYEIIGSTTTLTASYQMYRLTYYTIQDPSVDDSALYLQVYADSAWQESSQPYNYMCAKLDGSYSNVSGASQKGMLLGRSGRRFEGVVQFSNPTQTTGDKTFTGRSSSNNSNTGWSNAKSYMSIGQFDSSDAVTGIRLRSGHPSTSPASGGQNFTGGYYLLEGTAIS